MLRKFSKALKYAVCYIQLNVKCLSNFRTVMLVLMYFALEVMRFDCECPIFELKLLVFKR